MNFELQAKIKKSNDDSQSISRKTDRQTKVQIDILAFIDLKLERSITMIPTCFSNYCDRVLNLILTMKDTTISIG